MADVQVIETIGNAITVINQGTVGPQGPVGAQGVPGIDGASGLFVVRVTESTGALPNSFLLADTSGTDSGATYTFPSSPQTGWRERVLDVGGAVATKPITVAGNGHDINGGGETRTISTPYAGESYVFDGVSDSWRLEEKVLFDGKAAAEAHAARVDNPHAVTKAQVGLSNVTDDAQVKRSEMGSPWSDPIPATYASAASFVVASNAAPQFATGVRTQSECGADGLKYGTVSGVAGTTVTLSMDSGPLTANLTAVLHGNDVPASLCNHAAQHATGARDTLTPAAIGALGLDVSAEVSVSAATTLDATAFGHMHACSGTSADYPVTLPTAVGNAGKIFGIRIVRACTKLVTLTANGNDLIDGSATRVMWAGESAVLLSDGVGWTKIAGRTIPMMCKLTATAVQSIPSSAITALRMDSVTYNFGNISDLPNNRILVRRSGNYIIHAHMSMAVAMQYEYGVSGSIAYFLDYSSGVGGNCYPYSSIVALSAGGNVGLQAYHTTGSSKNTNGTPYPTIAVQELPTW